MFINERRIIIVKNTGILSIWLSATFALCLLAALLLAGTALGEVSREGLVGEWHFDGDAKDSSGNGNDGTVYGASFVEGKFGKALSFDGVGDYVQTPISSGTTYTLEAWIKPNALNGGISEHAPETIAAFLSVFPGKPCVVA